MLEKVKDMFVMNFGVGYYDPINDRWVEAVIPPRICPSGYVLCYPRIEYCPDRFLHWEWSDELQDWVPRDVGNWIVVRPTEFCQANPGCQSLWKLNP